MKISKFNEYILKDNQHIDISKYQLERIKILR